MQLTPAPTAPSASFTNVAALREAAPRVAGSLVEFTGGFTGTAQGGVIGDVVAMSGGRGPVLGDTISVVGAVAGTQQLFGGGAQKHSGHDAVIQGVLELLAGEPVLTKATIISPEARR